MKMTKQSQTSRILALLRRKKFVTNIDLNKICYRYSARIYELRNDGWEIEREYQKPGVYRYWLVREDVVEDTY